MANQIADNATELLLNGDIDFTNDTIKILLVDATFSWDPATDVYVGDIATLGELTGVGYERKTLASKTVTQGAGMTTFDAASPVWSSIASGETIHGAVVYKHVNDDTDSPIIAFLDVTNTPTNGQQVTFDFASTGIVRVSRKSGS